MTTVMLSMTVLNTVNAIVDSLLLLLTYSVALVRTRTLPTVACRRS
jgi:hypothetical protein